MDINNLPSCLDAHVLVKKQQPMMLGFTSNFQ